MSMGSGVETGGTGIGPDEVRAQLERLVNSTVFVHSKRLIRFLRFIVERALEGHPDSFKEYVIGVEVFDRGTAFDPRVDPIVRVEARRLRAKLRQYYKMEGRTDEVLVRFCKGSYEPSFLPRSQHPAHKSPRNPLTLVAGDLQADLSGAVEQALTEHRIVQLTPPGNRDAEPLATVNPFISATGHCAGVQVIIPSRPESTALRMEASNQAGANLALVLEQICSSNAELLAINKRLEDAIACLLSAKRESANARRELDQANADWAIRYQELARINEEAAPRLHRLRKLNEFLAQVINELNVGLLVVDSQLRVVAINHAAEQMWGLPQEANGESLLSLGDRFPVDSVTQFIRDSLNFQSRHELTLAGPAGRVNCHVWPAGQVEFPQGPTAAVLLVMQAA